MGAQGAGPDTAPAAAAACCDAGRRAVRERGGWGGGRRCGRRAEARARVVTKPGDIDTCDESQQMWGWLPASIKHFRVSTFRFKKPKPGSPSSVAP